MPGKPNVMKKWWKKVRKNRKRTNTSSHSDLEGEAITTSESGFEDSVEMGTSPDNTESKDEDNIQTVPKGIFDQYLNSDPPRGTQKDFSL